MVRNVLLIFIHDKLSINKVTVKVTQTTDHINVYHLVEILYTYLHACIHMHMMMQKWQFLAGQQLELVTPLQ